MDFLKMLDIQDSLPETPECQKEANIYRRQNYLWLNRNKSEPQPTVFYDLAMDRHENPTKMLSPRTFMQK